MDPPALFTLAVAGAAHVAMLWLVNGAVPEPYMDEIFHVPQAARYCAGRFDEWDPKITTFPGLYLAVAAVARVTGLPCRAALVRSVNAAFATASAGVLLALVRRRGLRGWRAAGVALSLALFPPHFFFGALAYTDAGATLCVLLLLWTVDRRGSAPAVLALSAAAVLFRQTNAAWVLFSAAYEVLEDQARAHGRGRGGLGLGRALALALKERRRVVLLPRVWPQALVLAAFGGFVVANGGIVVGDKANHRASLHWAQLGYFAAVGAAYVATSPAALRGLAGAARAGLPRARTWLALAVAAAALRVGSPVHPFLLADNRHYTFYVWQRWFLRVPAVASLPAYAAGAVLQWRALPAGGALRAALAATVAAVLVPSPLVEPRYYVLPFLVGGVLSAERLPAWRNVLGAAAVNAATVYVFVARPFTWGDRSEARFMW